MWSKNYYFEALFTLFYNEYVKFFDLKQIKY